MKCVKEENENIKTKEENKEKNKYRKTGKKDKR